MTELGAKIEDLQAAATKLRLAKDRVDELESRLTETLRVNIGQTWRGGDSEQFDRTWHQNHRHTLQSLAEQLAGLAGLLDRQADDQRAASGVDASSAPSLGSALLGLAGRIRERQALQGRLLSKVQLLRSGTPAEQLAWWNSLTRDERDAALSVDGLYRLDGLPDDVRAESLQRETDHVNGEITSTETEVGIDGSVKVGAMGRYVEVAAGVYIATRTFPDGHQEVDVRGELGAGAGFQSGKNSVGVAATGKGIKTFSFGTEAEARAFADQLRAEPTKFNEIFGHFRSADEVRPDEVSLEVGGKFHVELGESELDVSGGVEITRRDDETMSVAVKAEIEAAVPGLGAKAGCEFKIETNKNGTAVEASAKLTLESTAGASVEETVKSILGGTTKVTGESAEMKAGSRVEVEYKWDLADPVTAAQLRAIVDKMRSGSASIHDLQQLNKEATVIVKLSSVESTEQKWEAGIENKFVTAKAKVAVHQEGNLTSSVLIKPAGNTALIRAR